MFAAATKEAASALGSQGVFINNVSPAENYEMLTLFRGCKQKFFSGTRYEALDMTLCELLEEEDFAPDFEEKSLVEDFYSVVLSSGSGGAGGGVDQVRGEVEVGATTENKLSSVSLIQQDVDMKALKGRFRKRKISQHNVKRLGLKAGDVLTFVQRRVYNKEPVTFFGKAKKHGNISANFLEIMNIFVKGDQSKETSFTVPEKTLFVYSLKEIIIEDGLLEFSLKRRAPGSGELFVLHESGPRVSDMTEEAALRPLAVLPESTRQDLVKTLQEVLKDRATLTLLEQTLDERRQEAKPQSESQHEVISSFLALIYEDSKWVKDAAHLLISAMDMLPDGIPALLANCSPDTLNVLDHMVGSLKKRTPVELPETLPPSLREEGELRWVVELLRLDKHQMKQLRRMWDRPELLAEDLLKAVCVVVQGLSKLQPQPGKM